jgi:hypothetical protein
VRVTKAPGSLFGHTSSLSLCPSLRSARARRERLRILRCATRGRDGRNWERRGGRDGDGRAREQLRDADVWLAHQSYLPCGGARFGGGVVGARRPFGGSRAPMPPPPLKRAVALTSPPVQKKMPSPLSVAHSPSSPSRICLRIARLRPPPVQQQQQQHASSITRRIPQAPLRTQSRQLHPPAPSPVPWQPPPPSTMSPHLSLSRRSSYAHLSQTVQLQSQTQTRTRTQAPTQTPQLNTLHHVPRQRERARWRVYVWVRTGKPSSAWVC